MTLYKSRYRIRSTRMPGWDYAGSGWYFVTICTKDRVPWFGEVVGGEMRLSAVGEIVAKEWENTALVRPYVRLDEWVVMPNHVHGIIVIDRREVTIDVETPRRRVSEASLVQKAGSHRGDVTPLETHLRGVSTLGQPRLAAGSLGAIIRQFKSICTKRIWVAGLREFGWQSRYYDHVIRGQDSLYEIRKYIRENPVKWEFEKDNPENLYT